MRANLRRLHGVARVPADPRMRERLDEGDPRAPRACYRRVFRVPRRVGKGPERFA